MVRRLLSASGGDIYGQKKHPADCYFLRGNIPGVRGLAPGGQEGAVMVDSRHPGPRPRGGAVSCLTALVAMALAGCSPQPNPRNIEPATQGGSYEAQYRAPPVTRAQSDPDDAVLPSIQMNAQRCRAPRGGPLTARSALIPAALKHEALSPGDLVDLRVANDTTFTNTYVVSRDGTLKLPFLSAIRAQGRSPEAVESDIAAALVKGGFFSTAPRVSVLVSDFAPARVAVSGAVFEPHTLEIGQVSGAEIDSRRQSALGASTDARDLAVALRNAGGIRPDADLSAVELIRGGQRYQLDLRPMVEG
ncbi:hypothetical protein FGG78_36740, partial [Thioclava sp. BHET1]